MMHKVRVSLLLLFLAFATAAVAAMIYWLHDLPSVDNMQDYTLNATTTVYANDGTTVLAEFNLKNNDPVQLSDISDNVVNATISVEDQRFYQHGGVDLWGIARAIVNNVIGGSTEGASTITQQLVRNTTLQDEYSDMTIARKVREAASALQLESQYSKDQILEMYLNTINYGDNCYGIEAAAKNYFNTDAKNLTVLQAATLAGIPNSPTALNPVNHPNACKARRNTVLSRMADTGCISQDECTTLQKKKLKLDTTNRSDGTNGIKKYPYFTSYIRNLLLSSYTTADVYQSGMSVYTTLDPADQKAAENAAKQQYTSLASGAEVGLVSTDPNSGAIKAMVGGKNFNADQYNLITQAQRQPGSTFKTFTLLAAIQAGIDPNNTYIDCNSPITIGNWTVENSGNHQYGTRSIASAYAVSSNTGFAQVIDDVGPQSVANVAKSLGITSDLTVNDSLTLGTSAVTPLELNTAYAAIANGGTKHTSYAIEKIVDRSGNTIYTHKDDGTQVLDRSVACAAIDVMKGVFTSGTARSAQLSSGQEAAGKTGTTENNHDHWLCAFTPQLCTTVWIGNREEKEVSGVTGCYVWKTYMDAALAGQSIESLPTATSPSYTRNSISTDASKGYSSGASNYTSSGSDEDSGTGSASQGQSSTSQRQSITSEQGTTGTSRTPSQGSGSASAQKKPSATESKTPGTGSSTQSSTGTGTKTPSAGSGGSGSSGSSSGSAGSSSSSNSTSEGSNTEGN